MQVGVRGLLALTLACGAAACMVNDHGLGSMDAGRPLSGAAGSQGLAGSGPPSPGAAGTMPMTSGAAGTGSSTGTGMAGDGAPSGAAGDAAGTGADPTTGAAGDPSGAAGTNNGGAGVAGPAGMNGGAGAEAGMNGGAGVGATAGMNGGAGTSGVAGMGAAGMGAAGAAAGTGGKAGMGAAGTVGTGMPGEYGCADGTREGYLDRVKYPKIAACEGAWDEPGLASIATRTPQCNRRAGNDGDRPNGQGCSVADLCASGWSVCETAHAVATAAPAGCGDATAPYGDKPVFFLTRQRGTGLTCDANNVLGTNNLYGCGTIGSTADKSCDPFTRMLRDTDCKMNAPWVCVDGPLGTSQNEYGIVTKNGSSRGGVLCCKP
jgi:hypothetical protein